MSRDIFPGKKLRLEDTGSFHAVLYMQDGTIDLDFAAEYYMESRLLPLFSHVLASMPPIRGLQKPLQTSVKARGSYESGFVECLATLRNREGTDLQIRFRVTAPMGDFDEYSLKISGEVHGLSVPSFKIQYNYRTWYKSEKVIFKNFLENLELARDFEIIRPV